MFFLLIIAVLIFIRLVIGVQLYRTAQRNNLPNLYWLSAAFFAIFVSLCFINLGDNPLGNLPISDLIVAGAPIIVNALLIKFISTTFYSGKTSPQRWIFILHILFCLVGIYGISSGSTFDQPSPWLIGFYFSGLLVWGWHTFVAYSAYRLMAPDTHVENWVKVRYRLMIAYGVIELVGSILASARIIFAQSPQDFLSALQGGLALCNFTVIGLQILVWLTPQLLRRVFNQQRALDEISALNIFGSAMTEDTTLKSMACFYAIRATVSKKIGIEDSNVLNVYLNTMSYKEWEAIFLHSELRRILLNSGADNTTADKAIANAQNALVEKQSLLTLNAR